METFKLVGELREQTGKKVAKAYRREGKIPCVLYSKGDNVHFVAPVGGFRKLVYTPNAYFIELDLGGKKEMAILKDIQFHPVSDEILHVDFTRVNDKDPIIIELPVKLEGLAKGVRDGGRLLPGTRKLRVKGLMGDLPSVLVVDITKMEIGDTIQAGSLSFPNVEMVESPHTVVVQVKRVRAALKTASVDDEDDEDDEEGEEGEDSGEESAEE